jgi:hypothetical protein
VISVISVRPGFYVAHIDKEGQKGYVPVVEEDARRDCEIMRCERFVDVELSRNKSYIF